MITVNILEDDDVILPTDWMRQLSLQYSGQSDFLSRNSQYGGCRVNRLGWITAEELCPAFVGKTVGEFDKATRTLRGWPAHQRPYEFVRGNIPTTHLEPPDDKEWF